MSIARTIQQMEHGGAAAVQIEDQVQSKRCGHRPNKAIVSCEEMVERIKVAAKAKRDPSFGIMARTDAIAQEGLEKGIQRCRAYVQAGADMIFAEAVTKLEDYRSITDQVQAPMLANLTEFGVTPLFTCEQLRSVGVAMALYPLSAFRAMNQAASAVYQGIRRQGTQRSLLPLMQTREELYQTLDYHRYEQILDQLQQQEK